MKISNSKRGCGYLKPDSFYLRGEMSAFGTLPPFVRFVKPIRFLEKHFRGPANINGIQFEISRSPQTNPSNELSKHIVRLKKRKGKEENLKSLGHIDEAWVFDILMWVGESYYKTPESFIKECQTMGISKKISSKSTPPRIIPGITKLYVVHPRALKEGNEYVPGVIGYSYLTRCVYTKGDTDIPKWVDNLEKIKRIDVVEFEENNTKTINDF